jgi:hypothetical protein
MSTRAKHWLGIYALSLMLSAVSGCSSGSPRGGGGDAADAAPVGNSGADRAVGDESPAHSVVLRWTASTTPGVTYTVLRSTTNGSGYVSQVSGIGAVTWTDNTVESGATYYYVVDDSLGSMTSANSNQATAVIP